MPQGNQGERSRDSAGEASKIGLISAVIVAVIAATATVVAAMIGADRKGPPANAPSVTAGPATLGQQTEAAMPLPTCATCTSGRTWPEQASTGGAATFRDPRGFRGMGSRLAPLQSVEVVCRFNDPDAPPSVQPGWWYLIASAPWNRQYYSPATPT